jgi:hypothetical protein
MTAALLLDDLAPTPVVAAAPAAPRLTLAPEPTAAPKRRPQTPVSGDPMVDTAARLLSIPFRHVYAALWRVGVIEVAA